jgi:hypothetical protein
MVQCSSFVGGRFQKFSRNAGPEFLVGDLQLNLRLRLSSRMCCELLQWYSDTQTCNSRRIFVWVDRDFDYTKFFN